MTATLHIDNIVHDYHSWKRAFDKFDRFRVEGGVRHYRVSRRAEDSNKIIIDLDFETIEEEIAFHQRLQKVWATPQSQRELVEHAVAVVSEVLELEVPASRQRLTRDSEAVWILQALVLPQ